MKTGLIFLALAVGFFIWFSIAGGIRDIWPFGVLLLLIGAALTISHLKNQKK